MEAVSWFLLFCAVFSIMILIVKDIITENEIHSKSQQILLMLPFLLLMTLIAYRFNWSADASSDLYRYALDFDGLKLNGLTYQMNFADNFSILYKLLGWIFSKIGNYNLFAVFTLTVEYLIFFYIMLNTDETMPFTNLDIVLLWMLKLALIPPIMSIAAGRNTLAYAFFALGVHFYYQKGIKSRLLYIYMGIGVLIHVTTCIGIAIFVLSRVIRRLPWMSVFLALWGLFLNHISKLCLITNVSVLVYFGMKIQNYIQYPTQFDIAKSRIMIAWIILIFVIVVIKSLKKTSIRDPFFITLIAVIIGSYGYLAEFFLRACYPLALLFPYLYNDMKIDEDGNWSFLFLKVVIVFAFLRTGAGWLYQIYWF